MHTLEVQTELVFNIAPRVLILLIRLEFARLLAPIITTSIIL